MKARFEKTILEDGRCTLAILSPSDIMKGFSGTKLLEDEDSIEENDINCRLLYMLSEAYYSGYKEAMHDSEISMHMLFSNNRQDKKPRTRIGSIVDYRK